MQVRIVTDVPNPRAQGRPPRSSRYFLTMKRTHRLSTHRVRTCSALGAMLTLALAPTLRGQETSRSRFELEVEAGAVWQTRNDV